MRRETWRLVIAGWDDRGHEASLKQLCRELGLPFSDITAGAIGESFPDERNGASVVFAGPAFGASKRRLYEIADAFILPSHSEGLPMAVLEAWAAGLPVLMTEACNLPEGLEVAAAIRIDGGIPGIVQGLREPPACVHF